MTPQRIHLLIFFLVLVIIAALFYFFFPVKTQAPEKSIQTGTTTLEAAFTYTTKTITEDNKDKFYSITSTYPVFSLSNAEAQKNLNDNIVLLVNQETGAYKSSFDGTANPGGQYGASTFALTFSIDANQTLKNILPIKFNEDFYSAGAAHPGATIVTANYDLTSGEPISLVSLFRPGSQYLDVLSSYSINALEDKLGADTSADTIAVGAGPKEDNFGTFLITDQGLLVIFNEYQVASYAAGEQEITIPYSSLKNILNPMGALRSKISQ